MTLVASTAPSPALACRCCGQTKTDLYFLYDGGPEQLCAICWCWAIAHGVWNSR